MQALVTLGMVIGASKGIEAPAAISLCHVAQMHGLGIAHAHHGGRVHAHADGVARCQMLVLRFTADHGGA